MQQNEIKSDENCKQSKSSIFEKLEIDINYKKQKQTEKDFEVVDKIISNPQQSNQLLKNNLKVEYLERKQKSYGLLRTWEEQMTEYETKTLKICEQIHQELDARTKQSTERMVLITQFFVKRQLIEEQYSLQLQQNLINIYVTPVFASQKDPPRQKVYHPKLANAFHQVDLMFKNQSVGISNTAKYIKNNILQQILSVETEEHNEYNEQISKFQSQINEQKSLITKQQLLQKQKFAKYNKIFEITINSQKNKQKKDQYNWELKYKSVANQLVQSLISYCKLALNTWDEVINLELKRVLQIRHSFDSFFQQYAEFHGKTDDLEKVLEKFEEFEPQIETFKDFDLIIQCDGDSLKKKEIQKYFQSFEKYFQSFDITSSTLKLVLRVFRAQKDMGTLRKEWKDCEIVFTVDEFTLIYLGDSRTALQKPDQKLYTEYVTLQKYDDKDQDKCFLVQKSPGYIINSTKNILIKFQDSDELEMFLMYSKNELNLTIK